MSVREKRYSLPYVITGTILLGLIGGALMFTITDPLMQALFGSPGWSSSTTYNTALLGWFVDLWEIVLPMAVLVAILFEVWVYSRRGRV